MKRRTKMNDDLISRKALLKELEKFSFHIDGSANAMALVIVGECKKRFKKMIEEQDSAYDVNKNINQLNENKKENDEYEID